MKKTKKTLLYIAVFLTINLVCKNLTDDFSTDYLLKPDSADSTWAHLNQDHAAAAALLNQSYRYLGKGKQAFVFVSEDGKHVLKLFKPPFTYWNVQMFGKPRKVSVSKLPFISSIFARTYAKQYEEQKALDFQSYVNSFNLLKEETKLEYLHLAETNNLNQTITIYDKIGIARSLDLDSACFLVQEKTDMLYPTLHKLLKEKRSEQAKKLLDTFVQLSNQFISAGIIKPTTVEKNFGCIDLEAIQIDVGRVLTAKDLNILDTVSYAKKMDQCVHHMKKWLTEKDPALTSYLEELVAIYKTQHEENSP